MMILLLFVYLTAIAEEHLPCDLDESCENEEISLSWPETGGEGDQQLEWNWYNQ